MFSFSLLFGSCKIFFNFNVVLLILFLIIDVVSNYHEAEAVLGGLHLFPIIVVNN
jgi:hypothetical protein